jgi:hypothetical protein
MIAWNAYKLKLTHLKYHFEQYKSCIKLTLEIKYNRLFTLQITRDCPFETASCIELRSKNSAIYSGQINGYCLLSIIGSIPKKSLSTDSAVQYAPSTQA